ncbi:hypothetical protein ABSA28_00475 [Candidatus Hepatincolaceae symbiont of Richtersius coronifer]
MYYIQSLRNRSQTLVNLNDSNNNNESNNQLISTNLSKNAGYVNILHSMQDKYCLRIILENFDGRKIYISKNKGKAQVFNKYKVKLTHILQKNFSGKVIYFPKLKKLLAFSKSSKFLFKITESLALKDFNINPGQIKIINYKVTRALSS